MAKFVSTVLVVKDVKAAEKFYTEMLGFTVKNDFGANIIFEEGVAIWESTPFYPVKNSEPVNSTLELCFETSDIEGDYIRFEEAGIKFFNRIKEESWGQRSFRIFDPDGNVIEFGETFDIFVTRLLGTMTREQVIAKTGICEEDLIKMGF